MSDRTDFELIVAHLEGRLGPAESEQFYERLRTDPALRRRFALATIQIGAIRDTFSACGAGEKPASPLSTSRPAAAPSPRVSWGSSVRYAAVAIAAAIVFAACVVGVILAIAAGDSHEDTPRPSNPVATLIGSSAPVTIEGDLGNPGSDYGAGSYAIDAGEAQFILTNRVSVELAGRTQLVIHDNMSATLVRGVARFRCPAEAAGYTVALPSGARVVDLGTRFAIDLNGVDGEWVGVTEGRVECHGADGSIVQLVAGDLARIDPNTGECTRYARGDEARVEPLAYWSFDDDFTATIGGDAFDAHPVNGAAIDPDGREGSAARFVRGQSQFARVDRPVVSAAPDADYSYAAWYRIEPGGVARGDRQFVLETASDDPSVKPWAASYGLRNSGGGTFGQVYTNVAGLRDPHIDVAGESGQLDGWMHIVVVYDADGGGAPGRGRLTVYLNGEPAGSLDTVGRLVATEGLIIGGHRGGAGRNFDGLIDEVAFWGRALTPEQARRVFTAGVRSVVASESAAPSRPDKPLDTPG